MPKISYRKARRMGKKDGRDWRYSFWPFKTAKLQEPKTEQDQPAQFEIELLKAAENDIALEAEKWQELDEELKPKYCAALQQVEQAKKTYKKESDEAEMARREFENARQKYELFTLPPMSERVRNFWLLLFAIGEFPLNSVVFQLFGGDKLETYLMSAVICIAIPWLGHAWGEALRQEQRNSAEKGFILGIPVGVLFLLGVIAFIRAKFFQSMETLELLGIEITPFQITVVFIIINIGIFLLAVLVSYEACHPNKKQFKSVQRRYKSALKKLEKESGEAAEAGRLLAGAEKEFQTLRQRRIKSHQNFIQKANSIVDYCELLLSAYRRENMKVRQTIPACFKTDPAIPQIDARLLQVDWDCGTENRGGEA